MVIWVRPQQSTDFFAFAYRSGNKVEVGRSKLEDTLGQNERRHHGTGGIPVDHLASLH